MRQKEITYSNTRNQKKIKYYTLENQTFLDTNIFYECSDIDGFFTLKRRA